MIPGGASHTTLEKINYLRQIADDPDLPATVRGDAAAELERIDAGAPVHPGFERVRVAVAEATSEDADLEALAREAVARVQSSQKKPAPATSTGETEPAQWPVRAFVTTWTELADWWTHYDTAVLASDLTDEQITSFLVTADGTSTFADELRAARQSLSNPRRHLRAL